MAYLHLDCTRYNISVEIAFLNDGKVLRDKVRKAEMQTAKTFEVKVKESTYLGKNSKIRAGSESECVLRSDVPEKDLMF